MRRGLLFVTAFVLSTSVFARQKQEAPPFTATKANPITPVKDQNFAGRGPRGRPPFVATPPSASGQVYFNASGQVFFDAGGGVATMSDCADYHIRMHGSAVSRKAAAVTTW